MNELNFTTPLPSKLMNELLLFTTLLPPKSMNESPLTTTTTTRGVASVRLSEINFSLAEAQLPLPHY